MKTRHCGICIVGYYEKLNTLSTADLYEENREKKKELTLRSKGQKSFANSVNKFIIKALKRNYKTEKENRWAKETFIQLDKIRTKKTNIRPINCSKNKIEWNLFITKVNSMSYQQAILILMLFIMFINQFYFFY